MSGYFGRKTTWDDHLVIKAGDRNAPKFHDFTLYHKHPHFVRGFLSNFSSPKGNCHVESHWNPHIFHGAPGAPGLFRQVFQVGYPSRSQVISGTMRPSPTPGAWAPPTAGPEVKRALVPRWFRQWEVTSLDALEIAGEIMDFTVFFMDFHGCFMLVFFFKWIFHISMSVYWRVDSSNMEGLIFQDLWYQ